MAAMRSLLLAFSLLLAAACDKSIDPAAIDPYRAAVQENLAALDDAGRQVATLTLVEPSAAIAVTATRFGTADQLAGRVSLSSAIPDPQPDGILLDASMVGPSHTTNFEMSIGDGANFLLGARRVTSTHEKIPGITASAVRDCRRAAALKSVLVIRVIEHVAPTVTSATAFSEGRFVGELLGFELEHGHARFVGGFRFQATNSPEVRVRWQEGRAAQEQQPWLATDLKHNVYVALTEGLRPRAPNAQVPPTTYFASVL